jgi:hypothetical protein
MPAMSATRSRTTDVVAAPKAWPDMGMPKQDWPAVLGAVIRSLLLFIWATSFGSSCAGRARTAVRLLDK